MPPRNTAVTEARRAIILQTLWIHGPMNLASTMAMLKARVANGMLWPESDWTYARNDVYEGGVRQHLVAMARPKDARVCNTLVQAPNGQTWTAYAWNPEVLKLRPRADVVLEDVRLGHAFDMIAMRRQLTAELARSLYRDPFGLRRDEADGSAALPDAAWAHSLGPRATVPFDFAITDEGARVLVVHTERGDARIGVPDKQSWEDAVIKAGLVRAAS